jgi:hypothetical protein
MIKISELTPKGTNLENSDLLEVSEVTADGYSSKSITGAEIITASQEGMQVGLVSGTNIKTINSTSLLGSGNIAISTNPRTLGNVVGSNLTGLTNQISGSVLIPSGTMVTNNSIYVRNLLTKTAGSTTSTGRIYINTTNSLTGATLLGTSGGMNSSVYFQRFERSFYFDGTNLNVYNPTNGISTDLTAGTNTLFAFNPANDYYLIFAVQNSTTTPDNLGHKRVTIQIYD